MLFTKPVLCKFNVFNAENPRFSDLSKKKKELKKV